MFILHHYSDALLGQNGQNKTQFKCAESLLLVMRQLEH